MIPKSITRKQFIAAWDAFTAELGIDSNCGYFPLVITEHEIHFPGHVAPRTKLVESAGYIHPQGDPAGVLATPVTIRIIDDEARDSRDVFAEMRAINRQLDRIERAQREVGKAVARELGEASAKGARR